MKPNQLTQWACNDCGVNVIKAGEYYMADPAIWKRAKMEWSDNLCIGCLEARIGRELTIEDFCAFPKNPGGFGNSKRYLSRLLGEEGFQKLQQRQARAPKRRSKAAAS